MDKFGVETTRVARVCPICGTVPRKEGAVLLCTSHGSRPFELPVTEKDAISPDPEDPDPR